MKEKIDQWSQELEDQIDAYLSKKSTVKRYKLFTKEDLIGLVQWCCDDDMLYQLGGSQGVVENWLKGRNKK